MTLIDLIPDKLTFLRMQLSLASPLRYCVTNPSAPRDAKLVCLR